MSLEFGKPELLLLTPFFIALTLMSHYFARKIKQSLEVFHYPPVKRLIRLAAKKLSRGRSWRGASLSLKMVIIMLTTFGLANPFLLAFSEVTRTVQIPMVKEGDLVGGILLAVDVSASMGLQDVAPQRLEAAKQILIEFVQNASDKIRFGLAAFDSQINKSVALTTDKDRIVPVIETFKADEAMPCLEEFTDIGLGLQTCVDLLSPLTTSNQTCTIILVSDGFANYGTPNPILSVALAADNAVSAKIPVYALYVARMGQDANPELMSWVAEKTNGEFMEASNADELRTVLDIVGKYHTPTHSWVANVEIKTTVPSRIELGPMLMLAATITIVVLWVGNYKHYKTSF